MKKGNLRFRESYFSYILVYFFYFFSMAVFSSVLSVYLTDIGKSASEMSFIISSSGMFSFAVVPTVGYLSDRTGRPKLISVVLLICAGAMGLVFAACRSVLALFLLNGLIMSFINSVNSVCERMAGSSKYRYGALRVWGTLGYAAGAQAAGLALDLDFPSFIFVMFLCSTLLTILGFWGTGGAGPQAEEEKQRVKLSSFLKKPQFLLYLVISFFCAGCSGVNMTYAPMLLNEMGVSTSAVGTVLFFSTLVEIPVILFSNRFMDRFSGKTLLLAAFTLFLTQYLFYGLAQASWLVVAVMILIKAIASTLMMMIILKIVRNLVDPSYTTTGLSIVNSVNNLGTIALQNLGGLLVDRSSIQTLYLVMAGIAVMGMILTLFLKIKNDETVFS